MSIHPRFAPRRAVLGAALALCLSMPAWADTTDAQFQPAFKTFQVAQTGDSNAVDRANQQFEALLQADPAHPMLMAYSGAAIALQAKTTLLPWKKISHAEDGLARIDKALAMLQPAHDTAMLHGSPVSLQTRFTAASTFLNLPGFFNRNARGIKLLAEVRKSPLLAQATPGFQGAVLLRSAQEAAKAFRTDEARRDLGDVIQRGLPQAALAQQQLAELPK